MTIAVPTQARAAVMAVLIAIMVGLGSAGCRAPATGATSDPTASVGSPSARTAPTPEPTATRAAVHGGVPRGLTARQRRVDRGDPDQVATAFVVRLATWDTALDHRPNDAVRRAVAFAGPRLRAKLSAAEPVAAPGRRWNELLRHHGWTSVRTRLGGLGPAPTTGRTAVRAVSCTSVDHGSGGWISFPGDAATYIVRLRKAVGGGEWTVVGYTIQ